MTMATFPTYDQLMLPLMGALREPGGSGSIEEIHAKTMESTRLPEEMLARLHDPDRGNQTEIGDRLAWARTWLKKYGLTFDPSW